MMAEKKSPRDSGLDAASLTADLKVKGIWIWLGLPIIMDAISLGISKIYFPEYLQHVIARSQVFVSFKISPGQLLQLLFLALGEEIAWRSFYQKQLERVLPTAFVLVLSSVLFAIGHFTPGNPSVVLYDLFFCFYQQCSLRNNISKDRQRLGQCNLPLCRKSVQYSGH